jgi:hypothetical protein
MSKDLSQALTAIADRLLDQASDDPELRSQLRQLAQAVLKATETQESPPTTRVESPSSPAKIEADQTETSDGEQAATSKPAAPKPAAPTRPETSEPLPELTLGQARPSVEPSTPSYSPRLAPPTDADLHLIERRCRLKAEGARWAASRSRLITEGALFEVDIEPMDREIIAKAKELPDCFLWMNNPTTAPSPADLREFEIVARCFEAVADVLALLRQILNDPSRGSFGATAPVCFADWSGSSEHSPGGGPGQYQSEFEQCLDLLAEAQSALRVAIMDIDGPTDTDQMQVYNWLKATTSEQSIFIHRYMRTNDPADPSQWEDLASRIEVVDASMQENQRRAKQRRKLLNKVRHKLSLITDDPEGAEAHWEILVATVDDLIQDGLPPSNRELRELLVPVINELPPLPEIPQGFELVLREIDRFLALSPSPEGTSPTQPIPEVRKVSRLLEGRSMVLIGGERRRGSEQALKEAFDLRELTWIETREHQSIDGFEPYIARPDVAVVLLAIRWSSHSHGDVKNFCDRHDKPLVRLPTGYNPNQVAVQILEQCSERLE